MKTSLHYLSRFLPIYYLSLANSLLLSSCGIISTPSPLGHLTEISATNFNGVWIQEADKNDPPDKEEESEGNANGGVLIVKVTDPKKGELKILTIDSDTLKVETVLFTIRKIGTILIGNMFDPDSKQWTPLLFEPIGDDEMAIRLLTASGVRKALGLKDPNIKKSDHSTFVFQNDGLELSKAQQKQLEAWLKKIPIDKKKRDKMLEDITEEKDNDRIIFTRRIRNKEISQ